MDNFNRPGETLTFTAPSGGVVSGTAYKIGDLVVIATADVAETLPFEGLTVGVVDVPKVASEAWTENLKIHWDDTAKKFTSTAGSNALVGVAVVPATADVELEELENVGSDGMSIDGLEITILDYADLVGSTVNVTVGGVTTALLEEDSGDWEAETSNDATATSLAAAIDLIEGVSAAAVGAVVTVTPGTGVTAANPAIGRVRLDGAAR